MFCPIRNVPADFMTGRNGRFHRLADSAAADEGRRSNKKSGRLFSAACFSKILRGGGKSYSDGGFALAVGVVSLGVCAGVPVLVIRRISTRRFFARPPTVWFDSTGLSLPSPIR